MLFRWAVGAVCGYEAIACFTHLTTISEWLDEHPGWEGATVAGAIIGGLAAHWHYAERDG